MKPELIAESPNQVWSWDITKLMGPAKWTYFYLYVIIDIFSRRVVAYQVAGTVKRMPSAEATSPAPQSLTSGRAACADTICASAAAMVSGRIKF